MTMTSRRRGTTMDAQIERILDKRRRRTARDRAPAPREALDREEQLIRDCGPADGLAGRGGHPRGQPGPGRARRRAGPRRHQGRRDHQRGAARRVAAHRGHHRHPAAGRARPALPADPRPRDLRARADGRPRRVGRQGGHQARPGAAAPAIRPSSRDGRASGRPRPRRPAGAGRRPTRSRRARSPSRTTRSTVSITRHSTRSSS